MKRLLPLALALACTPYQARSSAPSVPPDLLKGSSRRDHDHWLYAHLEGSPERLGFQHGWLFAEEIASVIADMRATVMHESEHDWAFYRQTGERIFWPRVPEDLRAEIKGITAGVRARGKQLDEWDITAENAFLEIAWYYIPTLPRPAKVSANARRVPPGSCSAFIATGNWTRGGKVVIAHNNWASYWIGRHWNAILDIAPSSGHRFVMDTIPGLVHSGDDFYLSDAGLMVTETTIAQFHGFDPLAIPEFVRVRRAIQTADTIEQWIAIMSRESNGGYANDWLIGDRKTGEIAQLENGLRNQPVWRKQDGYFIGSNFAQDPRVVAEETRYKPRPDSSMEARHKRWEQLMFEYKGRIDVEAAKRFMADHYDVTTDKEQPSARTLCGHGELDREPRPEWDEKPYAPNGAVTSKATDSDLAAELSFWAAAGHACGIKFDGASFLRAHPEFGYQKGALGDLPGGPWALFSALK